MIQWRKVETGKCRRLAGVPQGAEVVAVNGRECFGRCEVCGRPVTQGQQYRQDGEGVFWHVRCLGEEFPRRPYAERQRPDGAKRTP